MSIDGWPAESSDIGDRPPPPAFEPCSKYCHAGRQRDAHEREELRKENAGLKMTVDELRKENAGWKMTVDENIEWINLLIGRVQLFAATNQAPKRKFMPVAIFNFMLLGGFTIMPAAVSTIASKSTIAGDKLKDKQFYELTVIGGAGFMFLIGLSGLLYMWGKRTKNDDLWLAVSVFFPMVTGSTTSLCSMIVGIAFKKNWEWTWQAIATLTAASIVFLLGISGFVVYKCQVNTYIDNNPVDLEAVNKNMDAMAQGKVG